MAARVAIKLREAGYLNKHVSEHSGILTSFDFIPYHLPSSGGIFLATIPASDKSEEISGVSCFMDGPRLGEKVSEGRKLFVKFQAS